MDYKKVVRNILSNNKTSLTEKINLIKHNVHSGQFQNALSLNPLFKKLLNKTPYFDSITDIYIKEPFGFSEDLKTEFRWLTTNLENYLEDINSFLKLKNQFETYTILDKNDKAKIVLDEIECSFGVSLWSIEANLFIEDRIKGTESNWNLLSDYLKQIKNPIYEFIISSSSKRVESKMNFESFLNQFQNDIDTINANGMVEDFFVFKNFNYPDYDYSHENLESVYFIANVFSVIDQYLILIDAIIYNIYKVNKYDRFYQVFLKKAKKIITNDPRIINLYNLLNDKNDFDNSNHNDLFTSCSDHYYKGNLNESLQLSRNGIKGNPLEFEFYEIYCKSLIKLKSNFIEVGLSNTTDKILASVYRILSFEKDEKGNFNFLLNTALRYMNTGFGKQILSLLSEIEAINERNYIRGFFLSNYNSQKLLYFHKTRENVLNNLQPILDSYSFKVAAYKLGLDISFENDISSNPKQNLIFEAIRKFNLEDYAGVIALLEDETNLDEINYYRERKISLLFTCYLNQNLLRKALLLFGQVYFDDDFRTRKIKTHLLFDKILNNISREDIENLIELPILISLHVKEYDLYEAYDDFLYSNNIEDLRTLDFQSFIEQFGSDKAIFFLENISVIDTIKYSSDYGSIGEVEEGRVIILKKLTEINPHKKNEYDKEINEIYRINSVRKVLKEVDEGRLYIDVNNLKKSQISKFQDDFKRFKEIEQSSSVQSLIGFNASNKQNWDALLSGNNTKLDSFNSAEYLAFKNIYLESRENFLFSKEHGLDSCLSTRIRHGALKNHIRSVFEKLNLVTSKLNNEYKDNEVWQRKLNHQFYTNIKVQKALKSFSAEIDNYTIFIVDKLIQIQTEKSKDKEDGIFTFFTNDYILFEYYLKNKANFDTTETIIEMLLTSLVNHTLLIIQKNIINKFKGEIRETFQNIIDKTISEIREFDLPSDCELIPNLIKSGTEIQKELEIISDWFYLNTTNSNTLLSIETVIDASIELTNSINPNFQINPEIKINCEPFGVYSSLIFVFNILLNNVISHSKLDSNNTKININLNVFENNYIKITFINNLKEGEDYSENVKRLETVKRNWNDHTNIERSNKEDKSGFDKIKRILIYETYSKTDKFDFLISKNEISIDIFFPLVKMNDNE